MNLVGVRSAVLTALITSLTSLVTLFGQEGVHAFSDISETAYATAIIGGIVAGLNGYRTRMTQRPTI